MHGQLRLPCIISVHVASTKICCEVRGNLARLVHLPSPVRSTPYSGVEVEHKSHGASN